MPPKARILPPVDCAHPDAPHTHGTYLMYKRDNCRCAPCSTAMSRRNKAEKVRRDRNNHNPSVDATATRNHLRALKAAGVSVREVARRTGYSHSLLERISRGALTGTSQATQDDVLSIPVPYTRQYDTARIDATGTRRRIRALVAAGHSLRAIALDAGISDDVPTRISRVKDPHRWVHVSVAEKIRGTYDRLWNQPPAESTDRERAEATMSRNRATRHGWLPPLAWDDDQIDDPAYTPNVTPLRGKGNADRQDMAIERIGDLADLIYAGVPVLQAITRTGFPTPKAAYEAARHQDRPDLVELLLPEVAAQGVRTRAAA